MRTDSLAPGDDALQHKRAPRPLPLFLEMVRSISVEEPALARRALEGLVLYSHAERPPLSAPRPAIASAGGATLRDHGGSGSPVVLIPSLINSPQVLDLPGQSLAGALVARHRVLLVDWGPATARATLDLGDHISTLLVPMLAAIGEPVALVGYCLGGTMALAAACLTPVRQVVTLAAPWRFNAYPAASRSALENMWRDAGPASRGFGMLPTEVLQAAFWSLDPRGVVAKFARLAAEFADSMVLQRFVALEDWANDGEPLPLPAARELIEEMFLANRPGEGRWSVGDSLIRPDAAPALHFTASNDRIVPAASVPPGAVQPLPAGHVGMIVGSRAGLLHQPLLAFLAEQGDLARAGPDR